MYSVGYWEYPETKSGWVLLAEVYADRPDDPKVTTVVEALQLKVWLDADKDLFREAGQVPTGLGDQQAWLVKLSQDGQTIGNAIVDWLVKHIPESFLGEAAQQVAEIDF